MNQNFIKKSFNNERDIKLSKLLSFILRHGASKYNINIKSTGFIEIHELLKLKQFSENNFTIEDIRRVVENNDKNRFKLIKNDKGIYEIKANQGHSINTINDLELIEIKSFTEIPLVIHGTYYRFWNKIKIEGLKSMNRNHIHFCCTDKIQSLKDKTKKISGFRENCEILIYLNSEKSILDGIKFYRSENNVILSSGINNQGIPTKYFLKVVDRKTGTLNFSILIK